MLAELRYTEDDHRMPPPAYWPWVDTYPRWAEQHAKRTHTLMQRTAELRKRLGKPAPMPARRPLDLDAVHHSRIGADADGRVATRHLVRAAVLGGSAGDRARDLLIERDVWFLAGLNAHIAAWRDAPPEDFEQSWHAIERDDWTREPFPTAPFLVGDTPRSLAAPETLTVVELWASWCPPCLTGLRELDGIAKELEPLGVDVVAISTDEQRDRMLDVVDGASFAFTVGWDRDDVFRDLAMGGLPVVFVIDENGRILAQLEGSAEIERKLNPTLVRGLQDRSAAP